MPFPLKKVFSVGQYVRVTVLKSEEGTSKIDLSMRESLVNASLVRNVAKKTSLQGNYSHNSLMACFFLLTVFKVPSKVKKITAT